MSEYGGTSEPHHGHVERSPISVPWVIAASVICGIGITGVWWFITTFDFLYFPFAFVVIGGAIMFMSPRAGLDHA
jgi:hypothetical protein